MSEFKGTKGSEQDQRNYAFNILFPNWDCEDVVGFYEQGQEKAFVVGYKQALKDSKAPEMLEMLEKLLQMYTQTENPSTRLVLEVKQLIKEATEL
jgi:hypothetical protein